MGAGGRHVRERDQIVRRGCDRRLPGRRWDRAGRWDGGRRGRRGWRRSGGRAGRRSRGGGRLRLRCRRLHRCRRDRLDGHPLALPGHPDPAVVPRREEALELARGQTPVRSHVVAVRPALKAPQRPDHADARDREPAGLRRIRRRREAGQHPGVVAVRDGDPHRQVGLAQVGDRRPQRGAEAAALVQPVAAVDVVPEPRRPARRIDAVGHRDRVAVAGTHVVEVPPLAGPRMVGRVGLDVAHDLDVGGGAPQPGLLGRERARAVEVDAAGPARERVGVRSRQRQAAGGEGGPGGGRRGRTGRSVSAELGRACVHGGPDRRMAQRARQDRGSCHHGLR